jgi:predicted metal-dependent hydrolase
MNRTPFSYQVRVSPRGRNVRLRVTVKHGLEVIVPRSFDTGRVPDLLERKKDWIQVALKKAESHRKFFEPKPAWSVPNRINLSAIGAVWHISARETDVPWVAVRVLASDRLLIFGAINDERACRAALRRWLMRQTRAHLVPRLEVISARTGIRFQRTFIRHQRTRWASCSRHRAISLNGKLLFLSPDLVDYVMVHELCHVSEMNHSKRFWDLVERLHPSYRKQDVRLREMWKHIPMWAA